MRQIAALAALLLTLPAHAAELTCDGPLAADSSEARLVELYGRDNVVTGDVPGPEGSTMLATTVFPNDPAKTMEFGWWDEAKLERLAYATVPEADSVAGLSDGLTVREVETLNGGPFKLFGFWWDYGGSANFEGGKLAEVEGGCHLSVSFTPGDDYPADLNVDAISGDQEISSTEPLLEKVDARVDAISIGYPDSTAAED